MTFKDRVANKPNRIKITYEDGGNSVYATVDLADDPVEVGTPLNALNMNKLLNKEDTVYIVSQGQSGKWYYRKWSNGDAECWATIDTTITTTENNEAGIALYLGSSETWSFPKNIFKGSPACTYDTYAAGYPMTVIHTLTKDEVRLRYLTKWAVSGNAKVSIIAKGRWK